LDSAIDDHRRVVTGERLDIYGLGCRADNDDIAITVAGVIIMVIIPVVVIMIVMPVIVSLVEVFPAFLAALLPVLLPITGTSRELRRAMGGHRTGRRLYRALRDRWTG
jgi:hypothetical protein